MELTAVHVNATPEVGGGVEVFSQNSGQRPDFSVRKQPEEAGLPRVMLAIQNTQCTFSFDLDRRTKKPVLPSSQCG